MTDESKDLFVGEAERGLGEKKPSQERTTRSTKFRSFPRLPPGWGPPSPSLALSLERASKGSVEFLNKFSQVRCEQLERIESRIHDIVKNYWADKKYDTQATFVEIKEFLEEIAKKIESAKSCTKGLPPMLRPELDARLKRLTDDGSSSHGLDELERLVRSLGIVVERYIQEIVAKKVEASAVLKCCEALFEVWERATGTRRQASAFAATVCLSIDPELTEEQVRWRVKTAASAYKGRNGREKNRAFLPKQRVCQAKIADH